MTRALLLALLLPSCAYVPPRGVSGAQMVEAWRIVMEQERQK
jgi:hypothetical protein